MYDMQKTLICLALFCLVVVVAIPTLMVYRFNVSFSGEVVGGEEADLSLTVYDVSRERLLEMELEEYVLGVVAAEMPLSFDREALKAQAVAARTYALRRMDLFGGSGCERHPGADICTDHRHCQAWLSVEGMLERWTAVDFLRHWTRLSRVVEGTRGLVLTHQGELVKSLYHSTSGGLTEEPSSIWHQDYPYLRAVESEWEEASPYAEDVVRFTLAELDRRLGTDLSDGAREEIPSGIEVLGRTETGRIDRMRIGGRVFTGPELREALGLRSTDFEWYLRGEELIFVTSGFGHGVGMSQYGAEGMARRGAGFREILAHYYPGTTLARIRFE